jgi:hypothetical protein
LLVALRLMLPPGATVVGLALKAETTRSGWALLLLTVTLTAVEQLLLVGV